MKLLKNKLNNIHYLILMVKKIAQVFNDTYDDEVEIEPLPIKTESDILRYYTDANSYEELQLVYDAIEDFNVDMKIAEYNILIYELYKDVVEPWIYKECPTHIFDTGLHNSQMTRFIDYVYNNTIRGKELKIVQNIYEKYLDKLQKEELESVKIITKKQSKETV